MDLLGIDKFEHLLIPLTLELVGGWLFDVYWFASYLVVAALFWEAAQLERIVSIDGWAAAWQVFYTDSIWDLLYTFVGIVLAGMIINLARKN
jgi:hypothetical protein